MLRPLVLTLALAATAVSASAQDWAKARLDKTPRHLEWVTVKHGNRDVKCFIGFPEVKTKATAVVLIHEIFGLTDWVRGMVDQFAEAGYIAIAPGLVFYGSATEPATFAKIKAPLFGFYGGNDARITAAVPKLVEDMKAAGKAFDEVTYTDAGHGFMRSGEQPDATEPNKKARAESWVRIKAILGKL